MNEETLRCECVTRTISDARWWWWGCVNPVANARIILSKVNVISRVDTEAGYKTYHLEMSPCVGILQV